MTEHYYTKPRPEPEQEIMARLVGIRKQHGLRVHQVAHRMGCSQGAISAFETSARRGHSVTLERLLRYADAIGADIHITPTEDA